MWPRVDSVVLLALLLLVLVGTACPTRPRRTYRELLADERIEDKFRLLDARSLLNKFKVADAGSRDLVGDICVRDLNVYEAAIGREELWARKMLDASSRIPAGILEGNIIELGAYDECVEMRVESAGVEIRGHHCTYEINPSHHDYTLPYKPLLSICIPASCSAKDVTSLTNIAINTTNMLKELRVTITVINCSSIDKQFWDTEAIVWGCVLGVYIGFIVLCTMCHLIRGRRSGYTETGLLWTLKRFSVVRSAKAIFSNKVHENDLPFVHGMRVISTFWIVMLHEYFLAFWKVNYNLLDAFEWFSSWRSVHAILGALSVDTFFTLSGFLMTYTFFKKIKKNGKFSIMHHYLHRFIRLTLPLTVVVLIMVVFLPKIASGPRWDWLQAIYVTSCRSKWWSVLLYVQNFVERDNYCALQFWSLSVDMQLFWLSPLILYPLYKRPKLGLKILTSLLLTSIILTAFIAGVNGFRVLYASHEPEMRSAWAAFQAVYIMPHTRASPWLLGILLGFEINKNRKLTKVIIKVGWIYTATIFIIHITSIRYLTSATYEYNRPLETVLAAVYRPAWSLGICWILYACFHKSAGPIAKILSHKYFLPLSRISYSIYLVHLLFPVLRIGTSRVPVYFNDYTIVHSYFTNLCCSIVTAFMFSIVFEMPALVLNDMILRSKAIGDVDKMLKVR